VSQRIEALQNAIEQGHGCRAEHIASTPIIEGFGNQKVWEGVVETFELVGHPVTNRCYAWSFVDNGVRRYTTILEIPPVDSPHSAVKVAIAAKAKRG
jgi:hypothetical protein